MKTNFTLFNLREIAKWARLIVALIAFISISQISQAQSSRFNNWYFGNNAGVSFASGSPVALTNGQLSTTEGCASISDASGNLMFYTNGISVWNRNHLVMSNGTGLLGHTSSTQSAIIVQKPLSTNIYYIFTADADVGANGICYSEVNMSLAGGLGAVTATKNILLRTPSSEKLTAVRHCNNRDLWIVSHDWSSNGFRTWLVTPTGLNTTSVTSSAGTVINGINQSAYGQLKSNPDGNKLLAGYYGLTGGGINKFELYDFNNSTGVVSNAITLTTETGAYGCEFSPNGRIAYGGTNGGRLVQFDLCSGIAASIQASKYVVGVLGPFIGSMQLGPDGKVYVSRNATSLSVINNPNTYGAGCNFVNAAVSLAGRGSTMGLPNMASFYMRPEVLPFNYAANCLNVSFTSPSANSSANSCASATSAIVGAQWNFNDPASGASNTSSTLNTSHTFSSTGVYQVQLILNLGCYYDTLIQPVNVTGFTLNTSTTNASCGSTNGTATAAPAIAGVFSYAWSNGQTTQTATGLSAGNYTVLVTSTSGCSSNASVTVASSGSLTGTVSKTNVACFGNATGTASASASGGTAPYTYAWSNGATGASVSNLAAGNYSVVMSDASGCSFTQAIVISQPIVLAATTSSSNAACFGGLGSASVSASGGTSPYTYAWSNGQSTSSVNSLTSGNYPVVVSDANGCSVNRTASVSQPNALSVSLNASAITCNGSANGSLTSNISGGTSPYSYVWSNALTSSQIQNLSPGTYTLTVTDAASCTATASSTLTQPAAISVNTSSTNASCGATNGTATATPVIAGVYTYSWSNGQTTQTATGLAGGNYTVTVTASNSCTASASVTVGTSGSVTGTVTKTDVTCFGNLTGTATANATAGTAPYTYVWSNGATSASLSNLAAGNYSVVMNDASGCSYTQSIVISQPTALAATTSSSNAACFGGLGSASVIGNGGTSPYSYVWSNGQTTSGISSLASGNYSVVVNDANGCSVNRTASVSQPTALSVSLNTSSITCNGSSNGSLTSSVSGGTLPYSYVWSNASTASQIQNLSPGTYTLTVTDAASCFATASSTLIEPTSLTINASSTNASCGSSNGTATVTPVIAGVYSYLWSNGQTTQTATGLSGGNYTVTITASNSCTASASVIVGSSGSVTGTVSKTDVACFGNSTGSATANASGGMAPYTYVWSNGTTSASVSNLSAGNYSVVMSDASGCSFTQSIVISQPTALSVTLSSSAITCNGLANGSLTSSVSGGTSPYSYVWSNASTASQIQNLSPGTYTLTVTDAASCSANATSTLTQPAAISLNTSSTNASCGSSNGTSTASPTSAGVYTYLWSNGQTTQTATGLVGGNYTVTVTASNSCTASASVTVGTSGSVTGTITKTDVTCFGNLTGTATANATGGTAPYSYVWSNGSTSALLSNLAAGNYSVVMSDASGCSYTQSIVISQPTVLDATASSSNAACFGGLGSASVTGNGGTSPYSYVWSNGQTTSGISSLASGNYSVVVNDANGCSVNRTASVSQPTALSVSLNTSAITCNGSSNGSLTSSVSGGTSPYSYVWSNASTASQIQNLSPGTFTLTVTDAASCSATASSTLIEPTSLTINTSSTNASCGSSNGTATATPAGAGVYSYLWSNGQTTQTASGLSGGNYTVTITASNSCTATASVTVGASGSVTGTVSKTDVACFGNSTGTATANASGGMAPYTYVWSNGTTSASVSNLSAGDYSVVMSDASGCTFTQAIVISQPTVMSLTSSASTVSCYGGSNGSAQLIVSGGTQPYLYSWNNGTSNATISNVSAGAYSCIITDANGCESNSQVIITTPAQLTAIANIIQPSCNIANGSIQLYVQGGVGTYNYLWNSGGVNSTLNGLQAGNYLVTITDQNACSISMNETLVSMPPFSVFIDGDTLLCAGEETQLSARTNGIHNAYSYFWDHGVTGAEFMTNPSETTTYTVTVQDTLGCVAQDSITIHVNQIPVVSIVADANEGCAPFCTSLHAVSLTATSFNWNLSNGAFYSGADVFPCFSLPGSYTLEIAAKDDAGCSAIINWDGVIQVNASPQANFTVSDSDVSLDEPTIEFNNHSIGANNYTYFFGDSYQGTSNYSNTSYTYRDSGNYEVMLVVENAFGCSDTAFHTIHIGGLTSFYIPNSFSPGNSDGLNDVFMPKAIGMSESGFEMSIYDRWGHLVFLSNSWAKGWDGFNNGTPVQQDVYVCKIRYREQTGKINEAIGSVTVAE